MKKLLLTFILFKIYNSSFAQLVQDSLLIEGNYRSFYFLPKAFLNNKSSLLFIMHGSGGNGKNMADATKKLQTIAVEENLILVYPNGYKTFWNECRKDAQTPPNKENINEEVFFSAMIEYFFKIYNINKKQVFAMGFSGGGQMAYKLAFTMPEKIRAITAIVANIPTQENFDCAKKNIPIPVMIVNGTDDGVNPFKGGLMNTSTYFGTVISTDSSFGYWKNLAGYITQPNKTNYPNTDTSDGKIIEKYTFKKKRKPEITLLKVIGGKHDYPNDIDVYLEAWAFFKRSMKKRP